MRAAKQAPGFLDRTMTVGFNISQVIMAILLVVVLADVLSRLFWKPIPGAVEIAELSLLQFTFLGAAWVHRKNRHVAVDTAIQSLKPKPRAIVDIITTILSGITFVLITWYGTQAVLVSYKLGYAFGYVGPVDLPRFAVLLVIPLGSLFLLVECFRKAYQHFKRYRGLSTESSGELNASV
ncbi:MAG: TRAP transporter small permease [Chloroflexota bacterium]|nr:TRAP transporter small permease [Chloroflexota bacterium]